MANRVLLGDRATGGYGAYVSRPGDNNVLTCAGDKLLFSTNHDETGSNFFSAGHAQVVPVSGGEGATAPVTSSLSSISASGSASPSYQGIASTQIMLWGSSPELTGSGGGSSVSETFTYSSIGSTSATLTNNSSATRVVKNVTFNLFSTAALF